MTFIWDNNGNLEWDGVSTYRYDHANRLIEVQGADTYAFTYNGLGDHLSQTVDGSTTNFILDITAAVRRIRGLFL